MKCLFPLVLRGLLPAPALLVLAALAGCDRPAASQSPPANHVATASAATRQESPAASHDAAAAAEPSGAQGKPVAEVQPAAHETVAAETPETPANPEAAPPAGDGPPRRSALRPKADRGAAEGGVEKITFDDLILGMQADMVYRPWMLESETNGGRAKELDGKRVRLAGVMHGGVESIKKNKEFVLLRNKECKFGPGGQADHLAKVFMKEGKTVSFTEETVKVEGTLRIKASSGDDGNTWSIYEIEDAELK